MQLKARSTEDLVAKADRAAEAENISRAELIRQAVEEYADEILDEATDPINSATDAPDDFDYLTKLGADVESLENLGAAAKDANEPYPVSHDIDVDWADSVDGWRRHRFPVLRSWIDASGGDGVDDGQMREYLLEDFDVSEATMYRDLRELPKQGCAYPMPEADPRWSSEDVREDILDIVLTRSSKGRDKHAQENPTLADLLGEVIERDFGEARAYRTDTVWWSSEEKWVSSIEDQLDRLAEVAFGEWGKRKRRKYQIVLWHFVEYLRDCEADVSGIDSVEERLVSEGSELVVKRVSVTR